jgi:hypothetical protein
VRWSCERGRVWCHERDGDRDHEEALMPRYRMIYGEDEQVVEETFDDVEIVREDGWTVLFRGNDAILRLRDEHVKSLQQVD